MTKEEHIDEFLAGLKKRMMEAHTLETEIQLGHKARHIASYIFPVSDYIGGNTIIIRINGGAKQ